MIQLRSPMDGDLPVLVRKYPSHVAWVKSDNEDTAVVYYREIPLEMIDKLPAATPTSLAKERPQPTPQPVQPSSQRKPITREVKIDRKRTLYMLNHPCVHLGRVLEKKRACLDADIHECKKYGRCTKWACTRVPERSCFGEESTACEGYEEPQRCKI